MAETIVKQKMCDFADCHRKARFSVKIVGRIFWDLCAKHKKESKL